MITRVVWAMAWADGQGVTYDKDSPSRGAAMTVIEAAVQALAKCGFYDTESVDTMLAAVTPLIRAAALEEAAKVIDDDEFYSERTPEEVAAAIRALISPSPPPTADSA